MIIVEEFQYEERNWQLKLGYEILDQLKNSRYRNRSLNGHFVVWINGDCVDDLPKHKQYHSLPSIRLLRDEIYRNQEVREGLSRAEDMERRRKEF